MTIWSNTPHGSSSTYTNHGCRCDECRAAWAATIGGIKARRHALRVEVDGRMVAAHLPHEMHGKPGTYGNHGCRCEECTAGWAADSAQRARRRKAREGLT